MSASSKFDLSSASPDRPLYTSGQRGSYAAGSLDRSASFRESMENPILSSLPNMTRSSSTIAHGDVISFFQCLRFDPKSMVVDHKLNRQVEFRRLAGGALGLPPEDSPPGSSKGKIGPSSTEDLRRLKAGLRESCTRARERVKIFNESLSVMNKCFPTIPSRKRSRSDALSNDRTSPLLVADRPVPGAGIVKMRAQNHASMGGIEMELQKSEERTKISVPNKRTRTSMLDSKMTDGRANVSARTGNVERDREILRLPNNNAAQGEDRTLSIAIDGWEKTKMKKKRSGIKPDVGANSAAAKPGEGYRELKPGVQQRVLADARSRLGEAHGFRPGASNGGVAIGKGDSTPQQSGLGVRTSLARAEQDGIGPFHDRRDRPTGLEKERLNQRAVNKLNAQEDLSSGSPTSSTKMNATTRAPRSGSGVGPKLSPVVQRATAPNDLELPHCTNKLPAAAGVNNRKRAAAAARSSSPPVTQWAGQRPQKISRTARRTNLVPIITSNDETTTLDTSSDAVAYEKRMRGNSPQHVKLKSEHFSAGYSESEESGMAEVKSRDKSKKSDEMNEKAGQNIQKMSTLLLPPRKNKVVSREDQGDGVRRQGRTGRGFTSTRAFVPLTVEKLNNVGTAKQLRNSRHSFDRTESKAGRPPTRKLSDRKAYTRHKNGSINAAADFLVGSDDGHEELLAATNAVTNSAPTLSSPFWKQMETFFRFLCEADIDSLKQQVNLESAVGGQMPMPSDVDSHCSVSNGFASDGPGNHGSEAKGVGCSPEYFSSGTGMAKEVPLYQRLIAAIITDEGDEVFCCDRNEDVHFDAYGSGYELEGEMDSDAFSRRMLQNFEASGRPTPNGYIISTNGRSFDAPTNSISSNNPLSLAEAGIISNDNIAPNGVLPDLLINGIPVSAYQYEKMSINERLLVELHSIGIFPEPVPDLMQTGDEEITGDIRKLEEKYHEQVAKKKGLLGKLSKFSSESRDLQEKEFEQLGLEKLVQIAYEKYMMCWGPNAHGMKSASGKMAKQAALAFVKRTLERCHEYEETGKSCFSASIYKEMFLSGISRLCYGPVDSTTDGEAGKVNSTSDCSAEVRASAGLGTQQSPSNNQEMYSSEAPLSGNLVSELTTGRDDTWSNRVKKRELSLDDVGGPAGIGSSLSNTTKGKRSERDREGKGNTRDVLSRNASTKIGRPPSANLKGDRKSKAKPKQKTAQLSASVNGLLGKMPDQAKASLSSAPKSGEMSASGNAKDGNECSMEELEDPIDLSGLQLPEMDVLGGPDDLGGQGQDIASWLNIDDDGLHDQDFMGLQIPMDDLSDLNMMV